MKKNVYIAESTFNITKFMGFRTSSEQCYDYSLWKCYEFYRKRITC